MTDTPAPLSEPNWLIAVRARNKARQGIFGVQDRAALLQHLDATISDRDETIAGLRDDVRRLEQLGRPGDEIAIHVEREIFRHGMLEERKRAETAESALRANVGDPVPSGELYEEIYRAIDGIEMSDEYHKWRPIPHSEDTVCVVSIVRNAIISKFVGRRISHE